MSVIQIGLSAAMGLGLAACIGAAPQIVPVVAFSSPSPFTCRIEAVPRGGQTEVRASLSAHGPVSGLYWLELARAGAGGSAVISQSGRFSAGAGETLTLGSASFGGGASALRGRLTLTWSGGEVRCPVTAPMVAM